MFYLLNLVVSGPRGDESRGVWEENDKEPWKSTAGKEEPLEVSE